MIFASLVDDPSSWPERFPTEEDQNKERKRIFRVIEQLVIWENTNNEQVLGAARAEIARSLAWARSEEPPDDPTQVLAYIRQFGPPVLDPFCGGGSIPLEAQRLGLKALASDLNPVAVLITKALIEIPPKFAGRPPINPDSRKAVGQSGGWHGAQGLAEDVRYYGKWMRDEAERKIGHLYPKADLDGGGKATVIAWLWARTVKCPNPACGAEMPLMNSFALSRRKGKDAWLEPRVDSGAKTVSFDVRAGTGVPPEGTVSRNGARCLICSASVPLVYVRNEGKSGRLGTRLVSVIADGPRGRTYSGPTSYQEEVADVPAPTGLPDSDLPTNPRAFTTPNYGITKHRQLFTNRQLTAMSTFVDLVAEARKRAISEGAAEPYADAIVTYLALLVGRFSNRSSTQCLWDTTRDTVQQVFARNALPMVWVFAEANPFSESSGNFAGQIGYLAEALAATPADGEGDVRQLDATATSSETPVMVCSDPPYYDNVPYADLSDFFYVWLRRTAAKLYPDLFSTLLVPKAQELIAEPARHGGWDGAAAFFEEGMRRVFDRLRGVQSSEFPLTLFYAFKQSEGEGADGNHASTGWETMLQGLIDAGWSIDGTWPIRTEQTGGLRELGRNSLASSVVLASRPRRADAPLATRRELLTALKAQLPRVLRTLQDGSVLPVDLAQAAIGPGMAIFTGYSRVLEADGTPMRVRTALGLINQVLDEVLAEQEGDFDSDTRWAIAWFEQSGFENGPFGKADTLSRAKNTSVDGMRAAGIVAATPGHVRLLNRSELSDDWDPTGDKRLTLWEITQQLVKRRESGGEEAAADLLRKLGGGMGEAARELAFRLYSICDRKKWAQEAIPYNSLVVAWPEIVKLASKPVTETQAGLFGA